MRLLSWAGAGGADETFERKIEEADKIEDVGEGRKNEYVRLCVNVAVKVGFFVQ